MPASGGQDAAVASTPEVEGLLGALEHLRERAAATTLPLETSSAAAARRERRDLVAQLDDYVLPRLRQVDAPLLAVVGGSTGAGKSTLVNSLVGSPVSQPGVLRPTTREPTLVHHPADQAWFSSPRILPGLARTTGAAATTAGAGPTSLRLVPEPALPPGLALLDAPDVDSVVTANRELAAQLLAAADLWLFVTTAARYADAVPWDLLRDASARSAAVAVVLDRVPPEAVDDVGRHLGDMLDAEGLESAPLFVIAESRLDIDGMLPAEEVEPLRRWLHRLAADATARSAVVRQTLDGALAAYGRRVSVLADAADDQAATADRLRAKAAEAYAAATDDVEHATRDGTMLRGEVLARWQDFVGTGDFFRSLEQQVGRLRDRIGAALRGRPQPGTEVEAAIEHGLEALLVDAAERAADRTVSLWRADPAGAALLQGAPQDLSHPGPDLRPRTAAAVRGWQAEVLELVRREGADKRSTARFLSFGVNGLGLALMVVAFAHTGGLTGVEAGIAGGTAVVGQRILEAVFGDQAVRELAARAREDLRARSEDVLSGERARFDDLVAAADVNPAGGAALRAAVQAVQRERDREPTR